MQGLQEPLWNAQPPPLNGSGFSLPFWDHTSYEHHGVSPQSVDHKQCMVWIVFIPVDHTSFERPTILSLPLDHTDEPDKL